MINQQRISDQMINTIVADTPYSCQRCGFKTNGEDLLKFHMRDWNEIHKNLRRVSLSKGIPSWLLAETNRGV